MRDTEASMAYLDDVLVNELGISYKIILDPERYRG